jgi:quercetin dioxygenase-like cupin family protein
MTRPDLTTTLVAGAALALAAPALAQDHADHVLLGPDDVEYAAGPPSIAEGAEFAVLYGDPSGEGVFAMRLRAPDGFHIPPHVHSQPEIVTVISGTLKIGMGEEADEADTTALEPGSFFAFPPGMTHYVYADGETVVQLNSSGPWTIEYVDPADDPRTN